MSLRNDDFNDNQIDTTFWEAWSFGVATALEQNQRLEIATLGDFARAGLVTIQPNDLSEADISVDVDLGLSANFTLTIATTRVSGTALPWNAPMMYSLEKIKSTREVVVFRTVGGVQLDLIRVPSIPLTGRLRVRISGGVIYFYEDDRLLWSESYALNTYNCYIYIWGIGVWPDVGTGYFDNFVSTEAPPIPQHILSVSSTPSGISFTVNGMSYITPRDVELEEGRDYDVEFPGQATVEGVLFVFQSVDASTNRVIGVNLTGPLGIHATFVEIPSYDVTITVTREGVPVQGAVVSVVSGPSSPSSQTTDANGRATFTGLAVGNYEFQATSPGFSGSIVADPSITASVEIPLSPAPTPGPDLLPLVAVGGLIAGAVVVGVMLYKPE